MMDHKTDNLASVLIVLPIFGAVFIVLWLTPPVLFGVGATIIALLALREYYSFFIYADFKPRFISFLSLIIYSMLLLLVSIFPKFSLSISIPLVLIVLFSAVVLQTKDPSYEEFSILSAVIFGFIYIVLPFSFLIMIRYMPQGRELITVTILIVWARELGAGLGGILFSQARNPINIKLNPRKTYNGAFIGLCIAILVAIISSNLFLLEFSIYQIIIWGFAIGVVCQLGDSSESYLKRMASKRNSSNFLGIRGGVLDIVDAFIFAISITNFLLFVWGF
jgi:phosphatidate cytidylyltransferase